MSAQVLGLMAKGLLGIAAALAVVLASVLLVRAVRSRGLAELRSWHADRVPEEFHARDYAARPSVAEYLERERRLLDSVQDRHAGRSSGPLNRYRRDGRREPGGRNLSFELAAPSPRFGALLLHGLSDSPYVMRALGAVLHERGGAVLALRLPGHGTTPGGLLSTRWQDWCAATGYGVDRLRRRIGDRPWWMAGFSTGAALALNHALLAACRGEPRPASGLILLAPAVDLSWVARFALWHRTLAWLPWFGKFRWQAVKPECDPCKYASFPKRAGAEIFRLTRRNWALAKRLSRLQRRALPPILAFQSVADDTVLADGIGRLLRRIGRAQDELVLFDANRSRELQGLVGGDRETDIAAAEPNDRPPPFTTTVVTNRETGTGATQALTWEAGSRSLTVTAAAGRRRLTESWPPGVFSLSHLALPIAPDDPLYGSASELGGAPPRGERGILSQPADDLLRLRFNPFWGYLASRVAERVAPASAANRIATLETGP